MKKRIVGVVGIVAILFGIAGSVSANHAWASYHWARSENPLVVVLGDNVTSMWDAYLATTASDWTASVVLDTNIASGKSPLKNCKPVAGRIEVCNSKYGNNGWLGIASVWINGDHITQGTVKMNDTYFNSRTYNTPAWRNLVLCQEVGHTLGLDHQDEVFANANLGTCMDYTNDPTSNQHPNLHDYEMLETIYAHTDTTSIPSTLQQNGSALDMNDPSEWGKEVRRSRNGRASVYERELDNGHHVLTHVFWAESRR